MKLTVILLLGAGLTATATGNAQVTLDLKDAPLETVFKEIQKQSNYNFVYNNTIVQNAKHISLTVKNATVEDVLKQCFAGQQLSYSIIDRTIIVKPVTPNTNLTTSDLPPPPIDVHGRVVNDKGQPLEGATVTVKGTNKRVFTDANGNFYIIGVDENATLVVSAVNIETYEIKVNGKPDLATFIVKTKITTGAVVSVEANTGYQKLKPNEIVGSVVVIDNKTLNEQAGTSILQRLEGITPGLFFNIGKGPANGALPSKTNISIRGISTINGLLDPLIVLDNFIYDGDINNINPNTIESITILKDGSATSIYGSQGGNGVIVITTKKSKFNQKFKIGLSGNFLITQKPNYYSLPLMTASDYLDVENFLVKNAYTFGGATTSVNPPLAITPGAEIFLKQKNGIISPDSANKLINSLRQVDERDEYNKYFNKTGVTQQYNLSLSGGTENLAWVISGSLDRTVSNLNLKNERVNVQMNNTYKPLKKLQLNLGIYYTNNNAKNKNQFLDYNSVKIGGRDVPYLKFEDNNGFPTAISPTYRNIYTDTAGGGKLFDWKYYPLTNNNYVHSNSNREDITSDINIKYDVTKWASLNISYRYQKQKIVSKTISDIESFNARSIINQFSQLNYTTGVISYGVPIGSILNLTNASVNSQNLRGQLDINRVWGNHTLVGIAGGEIRENISDGGTTNTIYGFNNDPLFYGVVDFKNPTKTFQGNSLVVPGAPIVNQTTTYRFASIYANSAYTFKRKYTFIASLRRDGSNIFGSTTNGKWKPLWSTGVRWDIAKESFYKVGWLPTLKIRGTLGYSGNVDLRKTALPIGTYNNNTTTGLPYTQITIINDPSLRWEQVRQINLGIDFSLRRNIISGSLDIYYKNSKDLYGLSPFDYTAGISNTAVKNVANMKGKGFDLTLRSININRKLLWLTSFNFSYNTNKVTKYFGTQAESMATLLSGGSSILPVLGKPVYSIAAYKWGGLNSAGNPQGYLNGQLSTDYQAIAVEASKKGLDGNIVYMGSASPVYFGNITNNLTWKGLSLSFNIVFKLGYYFRKPSISYSSLFSGKLGNIEFEKRWKNPGDELVTNVPSMVYTTYPQFTQREAFYSLSEVNVLRGDNARLQYINLGYTFRSKRIKFPFEQIQVYANVANLGLIWRANSQHIDPDFPSTYSPSRTYTMGIRTSF